MTDKGLEGVVIEHLVSRKGLEVDKAKIEVIQNLPLSADEDLQRFKELTKRFLWSLKHTNVGQTKFIKPN